MVKKINDQFFKMSVKLKVIITHLKRLSRNKGTFQDQVLNVFTFPMRDGS